MAVVIAMAVGAASTWRRGDPRRWRAVAGCAIAPLGTVGFLVWAALSTGRPDVWLHAEASGWGTTFDVGSHFAGYLFLVVVHGAIGPVDVAVLGAAAACVVVIARMRRRHLPGEVVAYVVGVLVLAVGTAGPWNSKYRIMMPALLVAAVLAAGPVSRLRPPARAALLVAVAAAGCWFSAYAIITYPHAI